MALINVKTETLDIAQLRWETSLPLMGTSLRSNTFFFYGIDTIECYIIMTLLSESNLEIKVNKGYYEPAKARITITVGSGHPIIEDVNNWKDSYLFANIPTASYEAYLPAFQRCKIQPSCSPLSKTPAKFVDYNPNKVRFVCTEKMANSTTKPNFSLKIANCNITITCTIEWFGFVNNNRLANLETVLVNLYLQPTLSDFEIRIGDVKLPVHKVVLAMRKMDFLAKLATDVNSIVVADVDADTMKNVLWYMYRGALKPLENTDSALKLLVAAVNYDIDELKDLCVIELLKVISIDNAIQILKVSYENKVTKLYQQILIFIEKNKEKISCQKKFKDLLTEKIDLMYEFMMLVWQTKK